MTISPPRHDVSLDIPSAADLLIEEARRKGRRRRTTKGGILLAVVVIVAMVVIIALRGPANPIETTSGKSGNATGANFAETNVANLAGSNTLTASGSRVWVAIDQESLTKNVYAVTELNASHGSLVRVIKNKRGSVVETGMNQKAGDLTEPGWMTVSGSHLWVTDDQYWRVTELNASDGSLIRVIDAKADGLADPGPIAVSRGHVWVVNGRVGANSVTELNASNGSLVRVLDSPAYGFVDPGAIAVSEGRVFVVNANGDSVTEINASNGSLIRIFNAHAGCCALSQSTFEWAEPMALAVSGSHLWIGDEHAFANGGTEVSSLVELNTNNGSVIRVVKGRAYDLSIPREILINDGHLWVENGYNSVTELNANTGALERVISTKLDPKGLNDSDGIAIGNHNLYVLNIYSGQKGSVTVINASSGKIWRVIG
jgi:outer membrane protein assembly factor BamB